MKGGLSVDFAFLLCPAQIGLLTETKGTSSLVVAD